MKNNHPATVRWQSVSPRFEIATYRGHKLKVQHAGSSSKGWPTCCLGYIDGVYAGTADSMSEICDKLFTKIDRMKQ